MKLINYGAEGSIYETENNTILKVREPQTYKLEQLDLKLRKRRTKRETNVLQKLYDKKINVPKILSIDLEDMSFEMEKVEGFEIKKELTYEVLSKSIIEISKIHKENIIHGDLTPLNLIKVESRNTKNFEIFIIDFGLSDFSSNIEDKAVDLHVFFSFLNSEIENFEETKENLIKLYGKLNQNNRSSEIINRLKEIELRGRNKNKQ